MPLSPAFGRSSGPSMSANTSRGFSLLELMVGIVVAMAAVVVVMQVFQSSEGARRTTTGGDDAQTSATIAMATLQRELRQAGQGLASRDLLQCQLLIAGGTTVNNLGAVAINSPDVPAGDANTDTLLLAYGSGEGSPEGDRIVNTPAGNVYQISVPTAFQLNDWVIASPAVRINPCALQLARITQAPAGFNVTVSAGQVGVNAGLLYNLGPAPVVVGYAVRNARLTSCDYRSADCANVDNWIAIADGIVSLRAQHGRDTDVPADLNVDVWDQTAAATDCQWLRTRALRLVLVARSSQQEKGDVDAPAPRWQGSDSVPPVPITLDGDWQRFRYRTLESTLPLRNMNWAPIPNGC